MSEMRELLKMLDEMAIQIYEDGGFPDTLTVTPDIYQEIMQFFSGKIVQAGTVHIINEPVKDFSILTSVGEVKVKCDAGLPPGSMFMSSQKRVPHPWEKE